MLNYKGFKITGVINTTVYDTGIGSTESEKRRLVEVLLMVSGQVGNVLQAFIGNERVVENLYDYHLDTQESTGSANVQRSTSKVQRIAVDKELPTTDKFMVAIQCGATAKDVYGCYVYEPLT